MPPKIDSDDSYHSGECTIVIPAYNEEESLAWFLPKVLAFCESRDWPVIIVNDGSTDGTQGVIDGCDSPSLTVLRHKLNRGYGGALKSGLRAAKTPYVVTMDSDGQHRLDDVAGMIVDLVANDADMVIGSRRDASHRGTPLRRAGKALIRGVARLLMQLPIYDLNSGLKMYRTKLVQRFLRLCPDSMAFSDVIALVFISQRCRVIEHPIEIEPRLAGKSTIGLQTATETLLEIVNIVVLFNPMKIFLPIALVLGISGFLWEIPFLLRGEGVQVGALLGMISGLLFFMLGLLAEQMSLVRKGQLDD